MSITFKIRFEVLKPLDLACSVTIGSYPTLFVHVNGLKRSSWDSSIKSQFLINQILGDRWQSKWGFTLLAMSHPLHVLLWLILTFAFEFLIFY